MTCFPPSPLAGEVFWVSSDDTVCVPPLPPPPQEHFLPSFSLSSSSAALPAGHTPSVPWTQLSLFTLPCALAWVVLMVGECPMCL